jgi:hypothetical protein
MRIGLLQLNATIGAFDENRRARNWSSRRNFFFAVIRRAICCCAMISSSAGSIAWRRSRRKSAQCR